MSQTKGMTVVKVGASAPDFSLQDADGAEWRLSDRRGKVVVLLFYPGVETPVELFLKRPVRLSPTGRRRRLKSNK